MGKSIGLLELKSIPVGIETADAVLKAANVELLTATPPVRVNMSVSSAAR